MDKENKADMALKAQYKKLLPVYLRENLIPVVMGLFGLSLGFLSLSYLMFTQRQGSFVPYLVTVDRQGSVIYSGKAERIPAIPQNVTADFMCDFIESLYTVTLDKDNQVQLIKSVYSRILPSSPARSFADEYYKNEAVLSAKKGIRRAVRVRSVVRAYENRYNVDFEVKTQGDFTQKSENFRAVLIFERKNLDYQNIEELRLNPLGLFISEITLSKKLSVSGEEHE